MSDYKTITVKLGIPGQRGEQGSVYVPYMMATEDDVKILWTNDAGLPNPPPQSVMGKTGATGEQGVPGLVWTPHTKAEGEQILFWMTNDGSLPSTDPIDIRGIQGKEGPQGRGFILSGAYDSLEELQTAHPEGEFGAAYNVGTEIKTVYVWDVETMAWVDVGPLVGPTGEQGTPGLVWEPHTKAEGGQLLFWMTNDGGFPPTDPIDIRGTQGLQGESGLVQSIAAGENVTVDNIDPANPVISASGGISEIVAGENVTINNADPKRPVVSASAKDILPLDNKFTGVNEFLSVDMGNSKSSTASVASFGTGWTKLSSNMYKFSSSTTGILSIDLGVDLKNGDVVSNRLFAKNTILGLILDHATFKAFLAKNSTDTAGQDITRDLNLGKFTVLATDSYRYVNIMAKSTTPANSEIYFETAVLVCSNLGERKPSLKFGSSEFRVSSNLGSMFLGAKAGEYSNAYNSIYIGNYTTKHTLGESQDSIVMGNYAARNTGSVSSSFVAGSRAVQNAASVYSSAVLGYDCAAMATEIGRSTLIGEKTAYNAVNVGYSTVIGNQGLEYAKYILSTLAIGANDYQMQGNIYSDCVFLGMTSGTSAGANKTISNQISIGGSAKCTADNQITLGNYSITQLRCQTTSISSLSDARTKEHHEHANLALCYEDVKRLPVSRYKYHKWTGTHLDQHLTGFMADDVEQVFAKCVHKADQKFPVLDDDGEEIFDIEIDQDGNEREVRREFMLEDVKEIAAQDQMLATLWGAVQYLAGRVEALEGAK